MNDTEGVIKFDLQYRPGELADSLALQELLRWRDAFHYLGAIGRDPQRYGGIGFGNISHRLGDSDSFIISGTQTGGHETALRNHFTCVDQCDLDHNRVVAHGPIEPSSESLTHGAIYALSPAIRCVVHGHIPVLWQHAAKLSIPATPANVRYGTPQMARAMAQLFPADGQLKEGVLAMLGHEDGVVLFGPDFAAAERRLVQLLEHARALD